MYGGSQSNLLDSSFNRQNQPLPNQGTYNVLSNSHNSSSIIQEHHMNSQQQNFKQHGQYSPQGSSYRYDDNQIDVNSSMNLGRSQKIMTQQQSFNNH